MKKEIIIVGAGSSALRVSSEIKKPTKEQILYQKAQLIKRHVPNQLMNDYLAVMAKQSNLSSAKRANVKFRTERLLKKIEVTEADINYFLELYNSKIKK